MRSDTAWQSGGNNQEPSVATGSIGHDCSWLLDPSPLLTPKLRFEPVGRAMVAGREAIRLHRLPGTAPAGADPDPLPAWASEIELAVDVERGILLRFATNGVWPAGQRVEFVEIVFDERLPIDIFRPSWTTSEGTSIHNDALTGLYNGRYFRETLASEVSRAHDEEKPLAVLLLDIDDFRGVNDIIGHAAGDEVLKSFAQSVSPLLGPQDTLCRIGGDEFAIILPGSGLEDAKQFYEIASAAYSATVSHRYTFHLSEMGISAGVAELRSEDDGKSLLQRADEALHRAKRAGGDRLSD